MGDYPEQYWHCEFRYNTDFFDNQYNAIYDFSFSDLQAEFLIPYFTQESIMLNGWKVNKNHIQGFNIVNTYQSMNDLFGTSRIQSDSDIFNSAMGVGTVYTNKILGDTELMKCIQGAEDAAQENPKNSGFWHYYIEYIWHGTFTTEYVFDLKYSELERDLIANYLSKDKFSLNGKIINNSDIKSLRLINSSEDSYNCFEKLKEDSSEFISKDGWIGSDQQNLRAVLKFGSDETNDILFPNNQPITKKENENYSNSINIDNNKVFVVHGRDVQVRETVCNFLRKMKLEPIVLSEQLDEGKTIIEKFEEHSNVGYAIILLTPDDEGKCNDENCYKPRARQNVVFEHGYFCGKLGRKSVCALLVDNVEIQSDLQGLIYKIFDEGGSWKLDLSKEMINAGISINLNYL